MTEQLGGGALSDASEPTGAVVAAPWILALLLRERRSVLTITGLGMLLALILALTKQLTFTSTFSFIPQTADDQRSSGLASLAGQFGIAVGGLGGSSQPPQFYADLLTTRGVLSAIAVESVTVADGQPRRVPLPVFLRIKGADSAIVIENTLAALRKNVISTTVAAHTTGVVNVSTRTGSPEVSLQIAERLLASLNRFNTETRRSQATEERLFTEGRLSDARRSLRAAEDSLQRFLQANKQYFTGASAGSPELTFQKGRLERELGLQQQVVTGLAQQYEDVRIREVRDTPVITTIEQPTLPALPDPRGRGLLVVILTIVAFLFGCTFVIAREGWRRQQQADPDNPSYSALANEWRSVRKGFDRS